MLLLPLCVSSNSSSTRFLFNSIFFLLGGYSCITYENSRKVMGLQNYIKLLRMELLEL